jgi:hypothetical protein
MRESADELDDLTIIEAIRLGALSGSYGYWARQEPNAARGLNRMRAKTSAACAVLLTEIAARAVGSSSGPSVFDETGLDTGE